MELEKDEVEEEKEKWRKAIIFYVVGESPTIGAVERFVSSQWTIDTKPRVYYHNDGYLLIRFQSIEDRDKALYVAPNTINNMLIITREWKTDFNFNNEVLNTLPLWVRFPNLPLNCWGQHL